MKKSVLILGILLAGSCLLPQVYAQEKQKDKAKNKSTGTIELELLNENMAKQKKELTKRSKELAKIFEKDLGEDFRSKPELNYFYGGNPPKIGNYSFYSSDKSSTLTLHKNFRDESASKKTKFTVDKDAKRIRFNIHGTCRKGEILIKISLPSGKTFNEIEIDPAADISWSQSLKIEEGEKIYTGDWSIEIKAVKAEGNYSFSISTF